MGRKPLGHFSDFHEASPQLYSTFLVLPLDWVAPTNRNVFHILFCSFVKHLVLKRRSKHLEELLAFPQWAQSRVALPCAQIMRPGWKSF